MLWLMLACSPAEGWVDENAPPPALSMVITPDITAGVGTGVRVAGFAPDGEGWVVAAPLGGEGAGPCVPWEPTLCLGITEGVVGLRFFPVRAGRDGVVELVLRVPRDVVPGTAVSFQAVDVRRGVLSNVISRVAAQNLCVDPHPDDDDTRALATVEPALPWAGHACPGDPDQLAWDVAAGEEIEVRVAHDAALDGDLDVGLFDVNGARLGTDAGRAAPAIARWYNAGPDLVRVYGRIEVAVDERGAVDLGLPVGVSYTVETTRAVPPRCVADPYEPNEDFASWLTPGLYPDLSVCGDGVDYYALALAAGEEVLATLTFERLDGDLDLHLLPAMPSDPDPFAAALVSSTGFGSQEQVRFLAADAGDYVLAVPLVQDAGALPGGNHYTLDLRVR